MGGLFLQHSPDKAEPSKSGRKKSNAKALQLAAHSLKSSSACIGAMHLSTLAKELEMTGRSGTMERAGESGEQFHLAVKAGRENLAPASSRSPLKRENAIYLQYLQYGHACQ